MGDDRPPVYYEGDVLIIRASAIGSSCLWELVAAGQGYEMTPVPDALQHAFNEGHRLEPVINRMLESEGYEITGAQEEGELVIHDKLKVRYHPDGFITLPGGSPTHILEDKTMADSSWQRAIRGSVGDIFSEYNWQLSVMMHANDGMPAMWVALNKGNNDGSHCDDAGKLHYETVLLPPISLHEIIEKAELIQHLVSGEDIVVSGKPCDDPSHYPCRFLYIRPEPEDSEVIINEVLTVADEDKEEVDRLVREYLMFKGQAEEAKQRQDTARDALIALGKGYKKLRTDKWIVPIYHGKNTSPDYANMPQELKERLAAYKKESNYDYVKGIKPLD